MRAAGILDAGGLIGGPDQVGTARCLPEGRTFSYLLHDASAEGGPRILVTQGRYPRDPGGEVRALCRGAAPDGRDGRGHGVDRVTLAGAFGAHISPKHAMILGMIPTCRLRRSVSAGNAAGTGARIALCNVAARDQIEEVVRHIHKVETAIEPRFQEHFVNASAIPNAVEPFPEPGHGGDATRCVVQHRRWGRRRTAAAARLMLDFAGAASSLTA